MERATYRFALNWGTEWWLWFMLACDEHAAEARVLYRSSIRYMRSYPIEEDEQDCFYWRGWPIEDEGE